jgi:hypothetical protein
LAERDPDPQPVQPVLGGGVRRQRQRPHVPEQRPGRVVPVEQGVPVAGQQVGQPEPGLALAVLGQLPLLGRRLLVPDGQVPLLGRPPLLGLDRPHVLGGPGGGQHGEPGEQVRHRPVPPVDEPGPAGERRLAVLNRLVGQEVPDVPLQGGHRAVPVRRLRLQSAEQDRLHLPRQPAGDDGRPGRPPAVGLEVLTSSIVTRSWWYSRWPVTSS